VGAASVPSAASPEYIEISKRTLTEEDKKFLRDASFRSGMPGDSNDTKFGTNRGSIPRLALLACLLLFRFGAGLMLPLMISKSGKMAINGSTTPGEDQSKAARKIS